MTQNTKKGFTIIELSISMIFVAILILSIAMITISMTGVFQRGLTLRYMDQKGREISELIMRDIRTSRYSGDVQGNVSNENFGWFCTARSGYFWVKKHNNTPDGEGAIPNLRVRRGTLASGPLTENHRLIRITHTNLFSGPAGGSCGFTVGASNDNQVNIAVPANATLTELLPAGSNADLVVKNIQRIQPDGWSVGDGDFSCPDGESWNPEISNPVTGALGGCVNAAGQWSGNMRIRSNYVSMILVLSTLRGNTSTTLDGDGKCAMDSAAGLGGRFNFCALNKFEFSARVGARQ